MTKEQKELLIRDLSARLPYGVKISIPDLWTHKKEIETLDEIFKGDDGTYRVNSSGVCLEYVKPYLFPLSSMTEEQEKELEKIDPEFYSMIDENGNVCVSMNISGYDWLLKNHFDIRGLIPMGLANDATKLNVY